MNIVRFQRAWLRNLFDMQKYILFGSDFWTESPFTSTRAFYFFTFKWSTGRNTVISKTLLLPKMFLDSSFGNHSLGHVPSNMHSGDTLSSSEEEPWHVLSQIREVCGGHAVRTAGFCVTHWHWSGQADLWYSYHWSQFNPNRAPMKLSGMTVLSSSTHPIRYGLLQTHSMCCPPLSQILELKWQRICFIKSTQVSHGRTEV